MTISERLADALATLVQVSAKAEASPSNRQTARRAIEQAQVVASLAKAEGFGGTGPPRLAQIMRFTIHPELPASDIQRARAWYKQKLGLDPVTVGGEAFDPSIDQGDGELLYDTGTARFGVYETTNAGTNRATAARLVTDDFDTVHAYLLANGVVFEVYDIDEYFHEEHGRPYWDNGALVSPDGEKTAWFKDSEGNILAIGSSP